MQVESDNTATIEHRERIWFFPDKFWQATKACQKMKSQS